MRVFPGKLDLNILSAGGAADTSTDPADEIRKQAKLIFPAPAKHPQPLYFPGHFCDSF